MQQDAAITSFLKRNEIDVRVVPVKGIDKNPRHPQAHFTVWVEGPHNSFDTERSLVKPRDPKETVKLTVAQAVEGFAYSCSRREGRDFQAWFDQAPYSDIDVAKDHWEKSGRLLESMKKMVPESEWGEFLSFSPVR